MQLSSSAFKEGEFIPEKYTCDGEDISPPLEITNVPDRADSLVLIVEDPDAPNGPFVHWTMWNIDADIGEIKEDSTPEGVTEGITDFGRTGYGGPCPPSGVHRYFFKLYAVEDPLNFDSDTSKERIEAALKERVVASSELMGKYTRG